MVARTALVALDDAMLRSFTTAFNRVAHHHEGRRVGKRLPAVALAFRSRREPGHFLWADRGRIVEAYYQGLDTGSGDGGDGGAVVPRPRLLVLMPDIILMSPAVAARRARAGDRGGGGAVAAYAASHPRDVPDPLRRGDDTRGLGSGPRPAVAPDSSSHGRRREVLTVAWVVDDVDELFVAWAEGAGAGRSGAGPGDTVVRTCSFLEPLPGLHPLALLVLH